MRNGNNAILLVNRVDDPVDVPFAAVKQMTKTDILRGGRASGRVFVEAEYGSL